ncbi:CBS domain-containing protein [Alkaliphilus hydrothermalis]|uniref:Acetoin utilization protein AcuB n=1 Tax=Alkaliphilus hydrothermalis TaxID=1482730 RepID=A0ABS2NS23_9FIRM|nr:CBS domain-containing protein [Alkaliphilus hydrothermalis]MBM7615636.1 acetoin utilization protein AcuB [Alkaliphilus hydrothermalis]
MYIRNLIVGVENLTTLSPTVTVGEALKTIEDNGFLSLPIIDGGVFKGCISTYDIYKIYFKKTKEEQEKMFNEPVMSYAQTNMPTVTKNTVVEDASTLLRQHNLPFIPVIDENGVLNGIVTHKALFDAIDRLLGYRKGVRFTLHTPDFKGGISVLAKAIKKADGNIISLVVNDLNKMIPTKEIVVRVEADDIKKVKEFVEKEGFKVFEVIQ